MKPGSIIGGLVTVPDMTLALRDYHDTLGLILAEQGEVSEALALSWGCPASAGARMATLRPHSGTHSFVRLVEQPVPAEFRPTTTYGWAAYEITVKDVFAWPDRLSGSGFSIVGAPKEIPGLPYFVAMQIHGPGREMLYLNESRCDTPTNDMPKAQSEVDHMFIVILAAKDRAASVAWYCGALGFEEGDTYVIPYTVINTAFGLPADTCSALTMVQHGRMPIVEIDDYPAVTTARPCAPGQLPPGNALVSLAVRNLDACRCDWLTPPAVQPGPLYSGRRGATTRGPSGELLELVELAD